MGLKFLGTVKLALVNEANILNNDFPVKHPTTSDLTSFFKIYRLLVHKGLNRYSTRRQITKVFLTDSWTGSNICKIRSWPKKG